MIATLLRLLRGSRVVDLRPAKEVIQPTNAIASITIAFDSKPAQRIAGGQIDPHRKTVGRQFERVPLLAEASIRAAVAAGRVNKASWRRYPQIVQMLKSLSSTTFLMWQRSNRRSRNCPAAGQYA